MRTLPMACPPADFLSHTVLTGVGLQMERCGRLDDLGMDAIYGSLQAGVEDYQLGRSPVVH